MTDSSSSNTTTAFVYVSFIRTTPERLWAALTDPAFISQYWFGMTVASGWKAGSPWSLTFTDGRVADDGEILEAEPPKRLVIKWQNQWNPELKLEGPSRCSFEIEPEGEAVKLTVTHSMDRPASKFINAVSGGWPKILSNLKSLIETGEVVVK